MKINQLQPSLFDWLKYDLRQKITMKDQMWKKFKILTWDTFDIDWSNYTLTRVYKWLDLKMYWEMTSPRGKIHTIKQWEYFTY